MARWKVRSIFALPATANIGKETGSLENGQEIQSGRIPERKVRSEAATSGPAADTTPNPAIATFSFMPAPKEA